MRVRHLIPLALAAVLIAPAAALAGDWSVRLTLGGHDHPRHDHGCSHGWGRPQAVVVHRVVRTVRRRTYVPGHDEIRRVRVRIPGRYETRVEPAVWARRFDPIARVWVRVLVEPERVIRTWLPGRVEIRTRRVWVPGYWIED